MGALLCEVLEEYVLLGLDNDLNTLKYPHTYLS